MIITLVGITFLNLTTASSLYRNPNDMCTANFHLSSYLFEAISKYIRPAMLKKSSHTTTALLSHCFKQGMSHDLEHGCVAVFIYQWSAENPHAIRQTETTMSNTLRWTCNGYISEWSKVIYFSILHIFYFCLFILPWYLPNMFRGTNFHNDKHSK